jgi:hypothetical protein
MTGFPGAIVRRDHFTITSEQFGLLRSRKKRTLICWQPGAIELPASDVLPVYVANGGPLTAVGSVPVTPVSHKRYGELDASDVWRNGFGRLSDLSAALEGFYGPGLEPQDWLTIYGIELKCGEGQ